MSRTEPRLILIALPLILVCVVLLAIIIAIPSLTGNILNAAGAQRPIPSPAPTPLAFSSFTPAPARMTTFRSPALGFTVDYPTGWRKTEKTLRVIFSPTAEGLDPGNLQDSAIWIGIPATDNTAPVDILQDILPDFASNVQVLNRGSMNLAAQTWTSVQVGFESPASGEQGVALMAVTRKNEVGYYLVALAPADRWNTIRPTFQQMMNSFRFTEEAVLRPTDATPPPTPTPTPTPVIYIVQPGDTLSGIAVQYGVDADALANRNGIEVPERLRSGQKLIIPTRR